MGGEMVAGHAAQGTQRNLEMWEKSTFSSLKVMYVLQIFLKASFISFPITPSLLPFFGNGGLFNFCVLKLTIRLLHEFRVWVLHRNASFKARKQFFSSYFGKSTYLHSTIRTIRNLVWMQETKQGFHLVFFQRPSPYRNPQPAPSPRDPRLPPPWRISRR